MTFRRVFFDSTCSCFSTSKIRLVHLTRSSNHLYYQCSILHFYDPFFYTFSSVRDLCFLTTTVL